MCFVESTLVRLVSREAARNLRVPLRQSLAAGHGVSRVFRGGLWKPGFAQAPNQRGANGMRCLAKGLQRAFPSLQLFRQVPFRSDKGGVPLSPFSQLVSSQEGSPLNG